VATGVCYVVARTTGAGWVVVLGCGLAAALVVGTAWPWWAVRRVRPTGDAPRDGLAGTPLGVTVHLHGGGPFRVRAVDPPGPDPAPVGHPGGPAEVVVVPPRRGILRAVTVEVTCAAPFGFMAWTVRRRVPLHMPVAVAPRPLPVELPVPPAQAGAHHRPCPGDGDLTRGVREYRDGEPIRLVHWPATARTGTVMIRETEAETRPAREVAVDLSGDPEAAEHAARRAAGALERLLGSGTDVVLHTVEPAGPCSAAVRSRREAGRRLARAVPGRPRPRGDGVLWFGAGDPP
jgi:uncharacterized protein (DUF58 family)